MSLTYSTMEMIGKPAPAFTGLPGTDGKTYGLEDFSGGKALVVMFICNHCPYVVAVQDRLAALAREYSAKGVRFVAINSNDVANYPDDALPAMKARAEEVGYEFPYLLDESQEVAKAYRAACTPDIYAFQAENEHYLLRYQGRVDDNWKDAAAVQHRELADALDAILVGDAPSPDQKPSMGCNIKWKSGNAPDYF